METVKKGSVATDRLILRVYSMDHEEKSKKVQLNLLRTRLCYSLVFLLLCMVS